MREQLTMLLLSVSAIAMVVAIPVSTIRAVIQTAPKKSRRNLLKS
jgi:ABC-type phosphate transport system permease subunit